MAQKYTVKGGDTLSAIGQKFGVDWRQISGYRSGDPNLIYPGEVLTLPGGTPVSAPKSSGAKKVAAAPTPTMTEEIKNYLNDYQSRLEAVRTGNTFTPFQEGEQRKTLQDMRTAETGGADRSLQPVLPGGQTGQAGEPVYDPITGQLIGTPVETGEIPEAPDLVGLFGQLRGEYGIDTLEAELNNLTALQRDAEARMRERSKAQEGEQVSLGVIGGRVGEIERQEMERIDFIGRQIQRTTDQLNSGYKVVDLMVNLTNTDFTNAMSVYQEKFKNNMEIYDRFHEAVVEQRDFEQRLIEHDEQMATANLQIYAEAIMNGNMKWGDLSADQQTEVHKLEIKSGLGFGFLSKLTMPPGSDIKSITTRTDQSGMQWADTIYVNPDGSIRVESTKIGQTYVTPTGGGGGGDGTAKERQQTTDSNWLAKMDTKGSSPREATIKAVQRFDVDKAGSRTVISRQGVRDAANYLMSRYGISESAAQQAVTTIINGHHYTVTG